MNILPKFITGYCFDCDEREREIARLTEVLERIERDCKTEPDDEVRETVLHRVQSALRYRRIF